MQRTSLQTPHPVQVQEQSQINHNQSITNTDSCLRHKNYFINHSTGYFEYTTVYTLCYSFPSEIYFWREKTTKSQTFPSKIQHHFYLKFCVFGGKNHYFFPQKNQKLFLKKTTIFFPKILSFFGKKFDFFSSKKTTNFSSQKQQNFLPKFCEIESKKVTNPDRNASREKMLNGQPNNKLGITKTENLKRVRKKKIPQ